MARRAGGDGAGRAFARHMDLAALAPRIAAPLSALDGGRGQDLIPGVTNGEMPARLAPHGTYPSVRHGDHFLGNARADWPPHLSDHITHTPTGAPA